ncbi:MAG TPA: hypothetical protein VIK01_04320 [Polyangiaceae bacterium]
MTAARTQYSRIALAALIAASGCRNLDSFSSKPGEAYCGQLLSQPEFQDGFLPLGSRPNLELELRLDTSTLTSEPGILRSNDATTGLCASTSGALFQDAPLRAIPAVDHDVLSTLTFGEGHEHDFFAWVDSSCQGTMLAVVSLMKNNQVEMRLFKPARLAPPKAPADQQPGFAMFHFDVQKGGCGF